METGTIQKTASQRIEELEGTVEALVTNAQALNSDVVNLKNALRLLGSQVTAMIKLSTAGSAVNEDAIKQVMVAEYTKELSDKVDHFVNQGVLAKSETAAPNSFVVGRELDSDGAVVNTRTQFVLSELKQTIAEKILGSKAGDILTLEEGKLRLEILELYSIQEAKGPEALTNEQEPEKAAESTQEAQA